MSDVRHHINPETLRTNICRPEKTGICKFAEDGVEPPHYTTKEEAREAASLRGKEEHGGSTTSLTKKRKSAEEPESLEEVENSEDEGELSKYSFIRKFKEQEERFEEDFDGIPTRFFNADLRKKNFLIDRRVSIEEGDLVKDMWADPRKFVTGMFQALSSPNDANISDEEMIATGERLGLKLEKITDPAYLRPLGVQEAWLHVEEHESGEGRPSAYIISSDKKIGQGMATYSYRTEPEDGMPRSFKVLDTRSLVGADRMHRKTGHNLIQTYMHARSVNWRDGLNSKQRADTVDALIQLEDAQLEGRSFKAQQKYVKENASSSSARAWEDKKNPKESHVKAATTSPLTKHFRKIEIDNDVDLEAFGRFEKDYLDVVNKLPKVPNGQEPELRIRRLGRHKAHGVYFSHKDVVSIDIHNSGSTVHEMAHQYDLAIKGNASLRSEFRAVMNSYSKSLKIPAGTPNSRVEYLNTPTEVLARGMEHFARFELGISNSLIDETKFENYDHEPFKDPEVREKMFAFIRGLYKEDENR